MITSAITAVLAAAMATLGGVALTLWRTRRALERDAENLWRENLGALSDQEHAALNQFLHGKTTEREEIERLVHERVAAMSAEERAAALQAVLALRSQIVHRRIPGVRYAKQSPRRRLIAGDRLQRASVQGITALAVLLAGRGRSGLRDEWRSHLAGETGLGLPSWQRFRAARGFMVAAMRYRLGDMADLAWNLADRVLRSRRLSNLFLLIPTTGMAVFIFLHEGTLGVMKAMESIGTTGGLLYGLMRIGRKWRDVKPPDPKPRAKD